MSCKIVIPSYKRADKVVSKRIVVDPIICVPESQYDEYKYYNSECEIVKHPDDVIGLPAKRNWMLNYFGELFMIDDDVYLFQRVYQEEGESSVIKNPVEVTKKINELHELAKMLEIPVFGFTKKPRPEQYNEFVPLKLNVMITGCAYGVIKSEYIEWDEKIRLKEDFYISGKCKYYYRKILVDTRYNFVQKDTFHNPGGLSEYRTRDEEKKCMLAIKKCFGDAVELKKDRQNAKKFSAYNITMSFKF